MNWRLIRFVLVHPKAARRQIRMRRTGHNAWLAALDAFRPQGWTCTEMAVELLAPSPTNCKGTAA